MSEGQRPVAGSARVEVANLGIGDLEGRWLVEAIDRVRGMMLNGEPPDLDAR